MPESLNKRVALVGIALFFVAAGVGHFTNEEFFVAIMPPYLPAHRFLVHLSGALEIIGGLAVLVAPVRRLAGWGLFALLWAVFPANLHMAMNPELFSDVSPAALYARLPFQFIFMAWVLWATRPEAAADAAPAP